jgi:hypothetical protein
MVWLVLIDGRCANVLSLDDGQRKAHSQRSTSGGWLDLAGTWPLRVSFFSVALPWRQSVSDPASGECPSARPLGTSHRRRSTAAEASPHSAWMMAAGAVAEIGVGAAVAGLRSTKRHGIGHSDKVIHIESRRQVPSRFGGFRSTRVPQIWGAARSSRAGSDSANTGDLHWNWPSLWNWCDSNGEGRGKPARELDGMVYASCRQVR